MGEFYGKGVNDAEGQVSKCKYYTDWRRMLRDCYSEDIAGPVGEVCEDWLTFSVFRDWAFKSDYGGFNALSPDAYPGCCDIPLYSPEACLYIPRSIKNLLRKYHRARARGFETLYRMGKKKWVVRMGGKHRGLRAAESDAVALASRSFGDDLLYLLRRDTRLDGRIRKVLEDKASSMMI